MSSVSCQSSNFGWRKQHFCWWNYDFYWWQFNSGQLYNCPLLLNCVNVATVAENSILHWPNPSLFAVKFQSSVGEIPTICWKWIVQFHLWWSNSLCRSISRCFLVKIPTSVGDIPMICRESSLPLFLREKHHYLLLKPLSVGKNIDLWNSHDLLVNIPTVGAFSKSLHSVRAFPGRGFSHYIYGNWTIHRWCSMIFPAQKPFI